MDRKRKMGRHTMSCLRLGAVVVFVLVASRAGAEALQRKRAADQLGLRDCETTECVLKLGVGILPCETTVAHRMTPNFMNGFGTLGGIFIGSNDQVRYAITNFHVSAEGNEDATAASVKGTKMCTADRSSVFSSDGFVFGEVVASLPQFDAALIRVYATVSVDCRLHQTPKLFTAPSLPQGVSRLPLYPHTPAPVFKIGPRTGYTESIGVRYATSRLENVAVANVNNFGGEDGETGGDNPSTSRSHFSKQGDSGSLIYSQEDLTAVAILLGAGGDEKQPSSSGRGKGLRALANSIAETVDRVVGDGPGHEQIIGHDLTEILQHFAQKTGPVNSWGRLEICRKPPKHQNKRRHAARQETLGH